MRSLSGVKPTGGLHIGNYFGAIRQFVELQEKYECYYFIADYHTLNTHMDPALLTKTTWDIVADYLALGLDPERSTIFLQSMVPEVAELTFLLSNITPMGLLQRAHSYKDQIAKGLQPNHGLFTYPLLMASDILLYDSNVVPVGKDQKQHLEITRDIAMKFNQEYGEEVFTLPDPLILESVAVVPGTDGQKMSKSYGNTIEMFAPAKQLKKQIMSIVTDATSLEAPKDPDKCNVVALYKLFADKTQVAAMEANYRAGNYGYGHAKMELHRALLEYFGPMREKREALTQDRAFITQVLEEGSRRARATAIKKIRKVKKIMGLVGDVYGK
ncbi:tryptophan--tRNA ligase [Myxococcota bacterium]|nr:tryptophan--tRNA ligase [Myxococcota bacterium]MBU1534647.1 tryptophan--tRNA ligase [Myxococcota bacterium]